MNLLDAMALPQEERERIALILDFCRWIKVDPSGHWLWQSFRHRDGHGQYRRSIKAHRMAYELAFGPIPDGALILHIRACNNASCVNPMHLYAGTPQDNTDDMYATGRARPRGLLQPARGEVIPPL